MKTSRQQLSTTSQSNTAMSRFPRKPRFNGQNQPAHNQADTRSTNKVVVTGYASYTQPQDLIMAFSNIGIISVEKCNSQVAVIAFNSEREAKVAIQSNRRIVIYGELLTIKPYSSSLVSEIMSRTQKTKRTPTRTKHKGTIIGPKHLNLTGDFQTQLDKLLAAIKLSPQEVSAFNRLYKDLESTFNVQWPGCSAIPFGSVAMDLGMKSSDVDCFIKVSSQDRHPDANVVKAKRLMLQQPKIFDEVVSLESAKTPIVKFFHIPTEIKCDVTFKTELGVQNSKLVGFLMHVDPRIIPMAMTIKYWAKVHDLSGPNKLRNYALVLLIVFYLQQPPISILPSVAWLQRDGSNEMMVDLWNAGFMSDRNKIPSYSDQSSVPELLGGFFKYYSTFDFEEMVVCPYLGIPVKKDTFEDLDLLPQELALYKNNVANNFVRPMKHRTSMCIQDPFELCHNVGSVASAKVAADLKAYFKFAANAYEKERLNECREFLQTILLQKPKVNDSQHAYRVSLNSKILNSITDPDWQAVVKKLVKTVFNDLLRIQLGESEKSNTDSIKEKDEFIGSVSKPVWDRKLFVKTYESSNEPFETKQRKITDAILATNEEQIDLEFILTITYCQDPKSAVIYFKKERGDLNAFRDCGKFVKSVMQSWLMRLLKSSESNSQNTAYKAVNTTQDDFTDEETDDDKNTSDETSSTE